MSYPLNFCSHSNQSHGSHGEVTHFRSALEGKSGSSNGLPSLSHTMTGFSVQKLSTFTYSVGGPRVVTEVVRPGEIVRTSFHPSTLIIRVENLVLSPNLLAFRDENVPQTQSLIPNLAINCQGNSPQTQSLNPNLTINHQGNSPQTQSSNPNLTIDHQGNSPQTQSLNPNLIINYQGNVSQSHSLNPNLTINRQGNSPQIQFLNPKPSTKRRGNAAIAQGNRRPSPNLPVAAPKSAPNTSSQIPRVRQALGCQNPSHTQAVAYDGITHSLPHRKNGPYTCPRCREEFPTSQIFASHVVSSHYRYESSEERKRRMSAKYKRRSLRILGSGRGLTVSPNNIFSLQAHQNSGLPSFVQGNPTAASMADTGIKKRDKVATAERVQSFSNLMAIKQEPVK